MSNNFKSLIRQEQIINHKKEEVSDFIVISDDGFTFNDWFSKKRFTMISNNLVELKENGKIEVQLKKTIQANEDENKKGQDGKAVKFTIDKDTVSIAIHSQAYGTNWELKHTHLIQKDILLSYAKVMINNNKVEEAKKQLVEDENFSMNLD